MAAYQQMGHNSENLLFDADLRSYSGAVLSPVNYQSESLAEKAAKARHLGSYDVIFDPQLYFPRADRGCLPEWSYYPSPDELETADLATSGWWQELADDVIVACDEVKPDAICSPAQVPREFSPDYFGSTVEVGTYLARRLEHHPRSRPIQTAIVGLNYLAAAPGRAMQTASILSRTPCIEIYLVLDCDTETRRELSDVDEIKGALRLISALESSGHRVIVAFSSSDMLLWKAAGATHCATGKFFNVRRFTSSRFEREGKGGAQHPYWFEESLVAFLRTPDIQRVRPMGLLDGTIKANPFAKQIVADLGDAWLGLGWKQYLRWFSDAEAKVAGGDIDVDVLLEAGERNWQKISMAQSVLMAEPENDGSWLQPWRRALKEYAR